MLKRTTQYWKARSEYSKNRDYKVMKLTEKHYLNKAFESINIYIGTIICPKCHTKGQLRLTQRGTYIRHYKGTIKISYLKYKKIETFCKLTPTWKLIQKYYEQFYDKHGLFNQKTIKINKNEQKRLYDKKRRKNLLRKR